MLLRFKYVSQLLCFNGIRLYVVIMQGGVANNVVPNEFRIGKP